MPVLLVKNQIKEDLLAEYLYVFINCKRTHCKALHFDRSGYRLWSKRLEQGQFHPHAQDAIKPVPEWAGLKLILEGVDTHSARHYKRYRYIPLSHVYGQFTAILSVDPFHTIIYRFDGQTISVVIRLVSIIVSTN